jgi:hypothetical protein
MNDEILSADGEELPMGFKQLKRKNKTLMLIFDYLIMLLSRLIQRAKTYQSSSNYAIQAFQ